MIPVRSARRLESIGVLERPGLRVIDLADVSFLDPVHLVGVAAAAHLAHRQGSRLRLVGLTEDQANYAARMRLGRLIEQFGGEHALPSVRERDLHDSLLEVQPLRTGQDVRDLTELVYRRVAGHDAEVAHALHVALAEVGSNVCDHAESIGFMAAQTIAEHGVLRFAVADAGVGLLGTLAGRGALDDRSALRMALSGTSRTSLPGHGTGLPRTVDIVSALGGEILLASGDAATMATGRGRRHHQLRAGFAGTIFEGAVPATAGRHRSGELYSGTGG
ncbi:MAG TPA: hypothetical protein VFD94_06635 [Jatrophihabitans sp.]|nr:hypothetical protein [Jatrophihabitans sp.]